jgi:hypothetical protein
LVFWEARGMAGNRDRIMRIAHRVPRINTFHGVKRRLPDVFYLTFVRFTCSNAPEARDLVGLICGNAFESMKTKNLIR